jgi:hypothetical protein
MSIIDVALEDESGQALEKVKGRTWLLGRFLSSPDFEGTSKYQLLRTIDLYGDTTFNRLQIDQFLSEWAQLQELAETDEEKEVFSEVESLATKCKGTPSHYLKFYGD